MKLIKYGFGLLLSVLLVTSCATKFPEYKVVNEDVSWESDGTTYSLSADETPITITIQRGVATEPVSVPFTLTDDYGVYTPSATKVDFAAGEYSKTITLSYNYSDLTPGTEYKFTLSFNDQLAGAGCFSEFAGNGMMALEYEDYLDGYYAITYAYGPFRVLREGAFVEELDDTPIKLQLAKGTTEYYKLIFLNKQVELEFKAVCEDEGNIEVKKYTGYNTGLRALTGGEFAFYYNGSDGQYYFDFAPGYSDLENDSGYLSTPVISAGDQLWLYSWMQLNGSWINSAYAYYHVIVFE